MTEAPDRIWTNYREANRLDVAYDEPPRSPDDDCKDEYISRAAHDAAVSAARKEGMLAVADEMDRRADHWSNVAIQEAEEHGNDFETARAVTKCATYSSAAAAIRNEASK